MKLKVTHTPLYIARGMIDEIEKKAKEAKKNKTQEYYEIIVNEIIDLKKFKIKPILVNENNCKIETIENYGINISGTSNRLSSIDLYLDNKIDLYLDVTDNNEFWTIELVN